MQRKVYVYRKSYNYYHRIEISLTVGKFILSGTGLSAFAFLPLAALSSSAGIVEINDKSLNISERKEEYKLTYKFYKQLQNLLKSESITEMRKYI